VRLWRPTGVKELRLVRDSGWRAWPPRLPDQPIFYPVTSFDYAEKIARDWNATGEAEQGYGFVTAFDITPALAAAYPVQIAGGRAHSELWVPAEDLAAFNLGIVGTIRVEAAYRNRARIDTGQALRELGL
jgi:hypothetical protein